MFFKKLRGSKKTLFYFLAVVFFGFFLTEIPDIVGKIRINPVIRSCLLSLQADAIIIGRGTKQTTEIGPLPRGGETTFTQMQVERRIKGNVGTTTLLAQGGGPGSIHCCVPLDTPLLIHLNEYNSTSTENLVFVPIDVSVIDQNSAVRKSKKWCVI